MKEYTPVEEVVRAWVIRGSHPGYHEFQKSLLRENWPTLYNAIEQLVIKDEYVTDVKAEAWDEGWRVGYKEGRHYEGEPYSNPYRKETK